MFKYCVWYLVNEGHPVYKMMSTYSSLFKTPTFPPHITIQSKLNKSEAIATYNRYLSVDKPVFTSHGHQRHLQPARARIRMRVVFNLGNLFPNLAFFARKFCIAQARVGQFKC